MPKKTTKKKKSVRTLDERKVIFSLEIRVLITVVVLAIYFVFGLKIIPVRLNLLGIGMLVFLVLTIVERLLLYVHRCQRCVLHAHYIIDLILVSFVMFLLSPGDKIYYLPLYILVISIASLVVSMRFGYVLACLSSLSLSLVYALLGPGSAGAAPCPYGSPINLLIINSSFFFLIVAVLQASLNIGQRKE